MQGKRALCALLLPLALHALLPADYFVGSTRVRLFKDQPASVRLQTGLGPKEVRFRWTLYKNRGLVVHLSYNGFVHQFLLSEDRSTDHFILPLKPGGEAQASGPYLQILYHGYNRRERLAELEYRLHAAGENLNIIPEE